MAEFRYAVEPEPLDAEDRVSKSGSPDSFLTPATVAAELNVSLHAVYNLIRAGDIQAVNVAPSDNPGGKGCWRIRRQCVDDFISQRLAAGASRLRRRRDGRTTRSSRIQRFIPNHLDS
ncbi:MAG: helix-turn-helix domain-containing protein [Phycisphaerae bacterium]|nr:helix-turn-helix domain-containing protein [Phycisphaerae bacterium]